MATSTNQHQICGSCGNTGTGKYCNQCGQPYANKRITLKVLLHDVFHFFTHLEKGFGYTLKQLIVAPGTMQREYVEGKRVNHQKPFSMFFICISICALMRYLVFQELHKSEANFWHNYSSFLYIFLVPIITLFNWLLFARGKNNYAETGVLQLYMLAFIFLAVIPISLVLFIWHDLDTAYIEFPLLAVYSVITFVNFYNTSPRWLVIIKSLVAISFVFLLVQVTEDFLMKILKVK
ncbi:MAG: DUF3667 domain-containing protein [Sediminibacterium sp.]